MFQQSDDDIVTWETHGEKWTLRTALLPLVPGRTFLIGPHQARLLLLLPAGSTRVAGNEVHVCSTVQQELHQADVTVETRTVESYNDNKRELIVDLAAHVNIVTSKHRESPVCPSLP